MEMTAKLSGALFDANLTAGIKDDMKLGLRDMLEHGEDFVREEIQPGHGYVSGGYHESIHSNVFSSGLAGAVTSTDARPIRTWLESGRRRGIRLRSGYYFWRHGKSKLKGLDPDKDFAYRLKRRLS